MSERDISSYWAGAFDALTDIGRALSDAGPLNRAQYRALKDATIAASERFHTLREAERVKRERALAAKRTQEGTDA